jgi:hypothetical protein
MGEDGRAGREFEPVTPASNTTKPDHRGSAEVRRKEAGCLFCPLPYQLSFPAARRSHVGIFHFVARDRHRSLLIGPVPIRKRAAFNAPVSDRRADIRNRQLRAKSGHEQSQQSASLFRSPHRAAPPRSVMKVRRFIGLLRPRWRSGSAECSARVHLRSSD